MVLPVLLLGAVVIGAAWFLPKLTTGAANDAARRARDDQKADERDQKGAFGNTVDFFFGNGQAAAWFGGTQKGGGEKRLSPSRGPTRRNLRGRGAIG